MSGKCHQWLHYVCPASPSSGNGLERSSWLGKLSEADSLWVFVPAQHREMPLWNHGHQHNDNSHWKPGSTWDEGAVWSFQASSFITKHRAVSSSSTPQKSSWTILSEIGKLKPELSCSWEEASLGWCQLTPAGTNSQPGLWAAAAVRPCSETSPKSHVCYPMCIFTPWLTISKYWHSLLILVFHLGDGEGTKGSPCFIIHILYLFCLWWSPQESEAQGLWININLCDPFTISLAFR